MTGFQCAVLLSIGLAFDGINLFTKISISKTYGSYRKGFC